MPRILLMLGCALLLYQIWRVNPGAMFLSLLLMIFSALLFRPKKATP